MGAAFLDLRKAFDSLEHCLLLHRLQDLGVGTVALQWFQSDRQHRIKQSFLIGWRCSMEFHKKCFRATPVSGHGLYEFTAFSGSPGLAFTICR